MLRELYRLSLTPELALPLERHVQNLVCEVPLPPAGRVAVACSVGGRARLLLQRAPRNRRVSAVNISGSLRQLFECLDPQRVVLVWRCLLAERPVLLVSSQLSLLGACAEALVSLLYPLRWQHPYIPVLPSAMAEMLQMPTTYLCGISTRLLAALEHEGDRDRLPQDTVIVRLDDNFVGRVGDDRPDSQPAAPKLPARTYSRLVTALERYSGGAFRHRGRGWRERVLPFKDSAFSFVLPPPPPRQSPPSRGGDEASAAGSGYERDGEANYDADDGDDEGDENGDGGSGSDSDSDEEGTEADEDDDIDGDEDDVEDAHEA